MMGIKNSLGVYILIVALILLGSTVMSQEGDLDEGAELFEQKCARCHGDTGGGGTAPPLRGCSICDSFESLFVKINADMPQDNPGDCIDTCAYDTGAFIFINLNGEDNGGGCFIHLLDDYFYRIWGHIDPIPGNSF
jgi:hypothetical protein